MRAKLHQTVAITMIFLGLLGGTAFSASFDDPDWPCIQRKVPTLSIGQMWSGAQPAGDWRADPEVRRLAETMAVRRTTLEEVKEMASTFAATLPTADRPAKMALLFSGVLDRIGIERSQVISGIGRYAHKQAELADRVKQREAEIKTLSDAPQPDLDKIEELQDNLNWDIRVYRERAQSLTYVCETPVLLEQRAFEIARILAGNS